MNNRVSRSRGRPAPVVGGEMGMSLHTRRRHFASHAPWRPGERVAVSHCTLHSAKASHREPSDQRVVLPPPDGTLRSRIRSPALNPDTFTMNSKLNISIIAVGQAGIVGTPMVQIDGLGPEEDARQTAFTSFDGEGRLCVVRRRTRHVVAGASGVVLPPAR